MKRERLLEKIEELKTIMPWYVLDYYQSKLELTEQTLRDIKAGFEVGGVNISTAGSINNGSLLSSMRLIMEIIWDNRKK